MNNWKIRKFLIFIFVIQIALLSTIYLEKLGIEIPFLRQIIAFFYLTFIPGILIIRILRMHKLTNVEVVLYSVGLSIASLFFVGFFMNMIYPLFGILKPLSLNLILLTFTVFVLFLSILSYFYDKQFYKEDYIDLRDIFSHWPFFICLIPFLTIIGTYLVNYYNNNFLLMFLIVIISVILILIAYNKIPKKYYPLAVFSISISLLFHTSLISNYIWGWDIHSEYHYAELVLNNALWNPQYTNPSNSVLSIVMLGPIFSIISNMDLNWVFKIVYPFLFSLMPVGLYVLFQKQTKNDQIAFLSCFFFMAIFTFYGEMLSLARQEVAELFLILLILSFFSKDRKTVLFVIFGMALIVSHYALAYIYVFIFFGVWIFLSIIGNNKIRTFLGRYKYLKSKLSQNISFDLNKRLSLNFVLLFLVFSFAWYGYVSGFGTFQSVVLLFSHVIGSINADFLNPDTSQGLMIITNLDSPMRQIAKYLHLITQLFIVVGFIGLFFSKYKNKFDIKFVIFSFFNILICFGAIFVPYFALSFNTSRLYYLSLIFLAPFCILGGIIVFEYFFKKIKVLKHKSHENSLKMVSIFLVIFFLFNTGFAIEFTNDHPSSLALSKNDYLNLFEQDSDVASARWLWNHNESTLKYATYFSSLSLTSFGYFSDNVTQIYNWTDTRNIESNNYIYIRSGDKNAIYEFNNKSNAFNQNFINNINEVYDGGNTKIYLK